jgi:hypothetical protein
MKNPFVKPTRESFKQALFFSLMILIASPFLALFFTFFSPSVAEATNPSLGECDVYYNGELQECKTIGEAIKINFYLMLFISLVSFIVLIFVPVQEGVI